MLTKEPFKPYANFQQLPKSRPPHDDSDLTKMSSQPPNNHTQGRSVPSPQPNIGSRYRGAARGGSIVDLNGDVKVKKEEATLGLSLDAAHSNRDIDPAHNAANTSHGGEKYTMNPWMALGDGDYSALKARFGAPKHERVDSAGSHPGCPRGPFPPDNTRYLPLELPSVVRKIDDDLPADVQKFLISFLKFYPCPLEFEDFLNYFHQYKPTYRGRDYAYMHFGQPV